MLFDNIGFPNSNFTLKLSFFENHIHYVTNISTANNNQPHVFREYFYIIYQLTVILH